MQSIDVSIFLRAPPSDLLPFVVFSRTTDSSPSKKWRHSSHSANTNISSPLCPSKLMKLSTRQKLVHRVLVNFAERFSCSLLIFIRLKFIQTQAANFYVLAKVLYRRCVESADAKLDFRRTIRFSVWKTFIKTCYDNTNSCCAAAHKQANPKANQSTAIANIFDNNSLARK